MGLFPVAMGNLKDSNRVETASTVHDFPFCAILLVLYLLDPFLLFGCIYLVYKGSATLGLSHLEYNSV